MAEPFTIGGEDRRQARRRPLLTTFFISIVLPEKGPFQLDMADISQTGAGFYVKSNSPSIIQVALDEVLTIHFYINQRLYLPLKAKAVRMQESGERTLVGVEFLREESEGYQALLAFLQLMDTIPHSVNLQ